MFYMLLLINSQQNSESFIVILDLYRSFLKFSEVRCLARSNSNKCFNQDLNINQSESKLHILFIIILLQNIGYPFPAYHNQGNHCLMILNNGLKKKKRAKQQVPLAKLIEKIPRHYTIYA